MPIVTWTVMKGIPPRPHEPKGKSHKKDKTTARKCTQKRSADSESESDEEESRPKKGKRHHVQVLDLDSEELETVDEDASPPAEEVDMDEGAVSQQQPSSESE